MDLRLREITWIRLLSLLVWTLLVMLGKVISVVIEVVERRAFQVSDRSSQGEGLGRRTEKSTLLPPLSDELVQMQIWPLLHRQVNLSLLWRLRRVNRAWKQSVGSSLQWAALELVRVDTPGLMSYLRERGERRPSLRERVEGEMRAITELLAENLMSYSTASKSSVEKKKVGDDSGSMNLVEDPWRGCRVDESGGCSCTCKGREPAYPSQFWDESSDEDFYYRDRESETGASSSESSLRAHYPRHFVRGG